MPAHWPVKSRPHKAIAYVAANVKPPTRFYGGCLDGDFTSQVLRDTEDAARADVAEHVEQMPAVPAGLAPHSQQIHIVGDHSDQYTAVCEMPDCTFSGQVWGTLHEAEQDRKAHVADVS